MAVINSDLDETARREHFRQLILDQRTPGRSHRSTIAA
jgi:hypothetical protein